MDLMLMRVMRAVRRSRKRDRWTRPQLEAYQTVRYEVEDRFCGSPRRKARRSTARSARCGSHSPGSATDSMTSFRNRPMGR